MIDGHASDDKMHIEKMTSTPIPLLSSSKGSIQPLRTLSTAKMLAWDPCPTSKNSRASMSFAPWAEFCKSTKDYWPHVIFWRDTLMIHVLYWFFVFKCCICWHSCIILVYVRVGQFFLTECALNHLQRHVKLPYIFCSFGDIRNALRG